jgi:hypothetical protein
LGLVGPGVLQRGEDALTWSDHVDVRPTAMLLMGLKDDYGYDGRALVEDLNPKVLPAAIGSNRQLYIDLAGLYKQLTAPFGRASLATLKVATAGIKGDAASYARYQSWIHGFRERRDDTAAAMNALLQGAALRGQTLSQAQVAALNGRAAALIAEAETMAAGTAN